MNKFIIVDGLPFLLAHGKTFAVRLNEVGFTVGPEVELASVPAETYFEVSIKAKCGQCMDSISVHQEQQQEREEQEQQQEREDFLSEMTVAEMKDYARENGIDLGEAKKKAEILEVIKNVIGQDVNGNDSDG